MKRNNFNILTSFIHELCSPNTTTSSRDPRARTVQITADDDVVERRRDGRQEGSQLRVHQRTEWRMCSADRRSMLAIDRAGPLHVKSNQIK